MTAGLLAAEALAGTRAPLPHCGKWELFRNLCAARHAFGVSDRDLAVLNALLSFHPADDLAESENLIVFPSNATLSQRAHGMPESTLRRHLAALVDAGLILRHDSPNGKRYARRGRGGVLLRAFGFDLRPLLVRADEITRAANAASEAAERLTELREQTVLILRDATKMLDYQRLQDNSTDWDEIELHLAEARRTLRRKLSLTAVSQLQARLKRLLRLVSPEVETAREPGKPSGSDREIERHIQNSDKDLNESESCDEPPAKNPSDTAEPGAPSLPLALVIEACPDLFDYAKDGIRHWRDVVRAADVVSGMMGVSPDAWSRAQAVMGSVNAAIAIACILQRYADISNPGGYLRSLTAKAEVGHFSSTPMVMALLNATQRRAA